MKYEKLADSLVSLLHGNAYQYKMYRGDDGKRTSNPYDARYFFVEEPNMMFIIDEGDNTLTVHKSNMDFSTFKPIHQWLRNLTRRYFINLEVKDYNRTFSPKDFSPALLRKRHQIDSMRTEAIQSNSAKKSLTETYTRGNIQLQVNESNDEVKIVLNGMEGITLPYKAEPVMPIVLESVLKSGSMDKNTMRTILKIYESFEKFKKVFQASKLRPLTEEETKFLKFTYPLFNKIY